MMTETNVLETALAAHDAGLSVIPIRSDGSKRPAIKWKRYQQDRADRAQVEAWFAAGGYEAVGIVTGSVSGHTVMLEMEGRYYELGLWQTFRQHCVDRLGEDRWAEITGYVELSPSGGPHVYIRCPNLPAPHKNTKLAQRLIDGRPDTIMETRGEGGFSVIAGSVGHESGKAWTVAKGSLSDIATVTWGEFEAILDCARLLDEMPEEEHDDQPLPEPGERTSSGDGWMDEVITDFNDRHRVLDFLPGWSYRETETWNGEAVHRLHRDGSSNDFGAVVFQSGRVGFFSSNAPVGVDVYDGTGRLRTYDSFSLALITSGHGNTVESRVARARALRDEGYGQPRIAMNGEPLTAPAAPPEPWEIAADDDGQADEFAGDTEEIVEGDDGDEPDVARRLTPIDWAELWAGDGPAEEWLVEPIMPLARQVAIWASHKTGKSLLTLEMAAGLATGRPCLLKPRTDPVDVIYLDMEMTHDDVRERLEDMGYGPDDDLSRLHYYLIPDLPALDTPEGGATMLELVSWHDANVVIIDTMSRVVAGDEDKADTYRAYYRYTGSRLKAAGVTVARLDHGGKDPTKGQRGSSAKGDDVDLAWQLIPSQEGVQAKRTLSRVAWVPEQVMLRRDEERGLRHVVVGGNGWPSGTWDVAREMDALGIPIDQSVRKTAQAYRTAGGQAKNAVIRAAIKYRKQNAQEEDA